MARGRDRRFLDHAPLAVGFAARQLTRQAAQREYVAILSYELWIIDARLGAPHSLGVIGSAGRAESLAAYDRAVVENATYAVTVEPPGGAPNGKPSGPPVFVGTLIPVGP